MQQWSSCARPQLHHAVALLHRAAHLALMGNLLGHQTTSGLLLKQPSRLMHGCGRGHQAVPCAMMHPGAGPCLVQQMQRPPSRCGC